MKCVAPRRLKSPKCALSSRLLVCLLFDVAAALLEKTPTGFAGKQGGLADQSWHELWLHLFWLTFWLYRILYLTYMGGEAPPYK